MNMTTLKYPLFLQALLKLADNAQAHLPYGIIPWTAFTNNPPPKTLSQSDWETYQWNPPQFAASAQPNHYASADHTAMHKPSWNNLTSTAQHILLNQTRANKLDKLNHKLHHSNLFHHNGRLWQADPHSSLAILAAALRANSNPAEWPNNFVWLDAHNNHVPMTPSDIIKLAAALATWQNTSRINARNIKDRLNAASSLDQLKLIHT